MKKVLAISAAVAIVAMAGSAFAATATTTVAVSASITGACTVTSAGSIAYGALDPLAGTAPTVVVTQPVVNCTNGLAVTIADDMGKNAASAGIAPARMHNSTTGGATTNDYIAYAFSHSTSASGTGSTTALNINLAATALPLVNYQNALAGTYGDTITMTLTF